MAKRRNPIAKALRTPRFKPQIVEAKKRPRYTLAELLRQCDFDLPMSVEEKEWLDVPAVGREVL